MFYSSKLEQAHMKGLPKFFRTNAGKLDGLNGTRKIGPSYAKSVIYIRHILDMHGTGTKHIVHYRQKSVVQWSINYPSSPLSEPSKATFQVP